MTLPRPFLSTQMTAECEQCAGRVDLVRGGICLKCERVLCAAHLHGSVLRRVIADVRGTSICTACRRAAAAGARATP